MTLNVLHWYLTMTAQPSLLGHKKRQTELPLDQQPVFWSSPRQERPVLVAIRLRLISCQYGNEPKMNLAAK